MAGSTVSLKDEANGRKVDAAGSVPTLCFLCFLLDFIAFRRSRGGAESLCR